MFKFLSGVIIASFAWIALWAVKECLRREGYPSDQLDLHERQTEFYVGHAPTLDSSARLFVGGLPNRKNGNIVVLSLRDSDLYESVVPVMKDVAESGARLVRRAKE